MRTLLKLATLTLLLLGLNARAQNYQNPAVYTDRPYIGTSAGNFYVNTGTPISTTSVWEFRNVCIDLWEIPIAPVPALPPGFLFGVFSNERWAIQRGSLPFTSFDPWPSGSPGVGQEFNNGYVVRIEFESPYALDPNHPEGYVVAAFEYWDGLSSTYRDVPFHAPIGSRYVDWFVGWRPGSGPTVYLLGSGSGSPSDPTSTYSASGMAFILDSVTTAIWPGGSPNWSACSCNGVGDVWYPWNQPIWSAVALRASN